MEVITTIAAVIFLIGLGVALAAFIVGSIIKQIYVIKDLRACTRENAKRMTQGLPPFGLQVTVKRLKRTTAEAEKKTEA